MNAIAAKNDNTALKTAVVVTIIVVGYVWGYVLGGYTVPTAIGALFWAATFGLVTSFIMTVMGIEYRYIRWLWTFVLVTFGGFYMFLPSL